MRKGLQPGCLAGVRYALFGLGDSGYPEFNVSRAQLGLCCNGGVQQCVALCGAAVLCQCDPTA